MKSISFAFGAGVCSVNRLKATARHFQDTNGAPALAAFLRTVAGVSRIEDVPESDRFRVNCEMRSAIRSVEESAPPLHTALARIAPRAFAKMVRR